MTTHSEDVVLLDEHATPIGRAPKRDVHTSATPLHLGFSCYAIGADGRLLLTRRALAKTTWPGVWTNSFCGHPAPGEILTDAVARRARKELDLALDRIDEALPTFRYRAVDASGIVENEVCPVYIARISADPRPEPTEVAEWAWVEIHALARAVQAVPIAFSPWLALQLPSLLPSLARSVR